MSAAKLCYLLDNQPQERSLIGDELTIGRSPQMHWVVPDSVAGISRHHATLKRRGGRWWLDDAGSRNGSFVNQQRITSTELRDGDIINLGLFEMHFVAGDVSGAPRPKNWAQRTIETEPPFDADEAPGQRSAPQPISKSSLPTPAVAFADREPSLVSMSIDLARFNQAEPTRDELFTEDFGLAQHPVPAGAPAPKSLTLGTDQAWSIALFSEVGRALQVSTDLDELLEVVLSLLFTYVPADRGMIGLLDPSDGTVIPSVIRSNTTLPNQRFDVSRTILRRAINYRTALLVEDTIDDSEYVRAESIQRQSIHSAVCVPLYREGRISGVIYLDTQDAEHPFGVRDLQITTALALFTAVAVEQFQLRAKALEEERKRQRLARYSSPSVVERILRGGDEGHMLADKEEVTVLFSDLKGFTSLSEKLPPADVVEVLNSVFARLTDAVFRQQGTLDKFMGDGMLAFFGAPLQFADHALRAVNAAWEMLAAIEEFNQGRPPDTHIGVRIGINTGPVIVGDIGSLTRKDYTVIGDTVNVASRLESSVSGTDQITIGPATFAAVESEFECLPLPPVKLKGKSEPIQPYRVLGPKTG